MGCTVVNTEKFPGCSGKGKTIVNKLTMVFLLITFDEFGWTGVFGLTVFENAPGITPSEITLAFAGYPGPGSAIDAGYVLGQEWMLISEFIKQYLPLVLSFGVLGISVYVTYQYRAYLPLLARFYTRAAKNRTDKGS